MTILPAAASLPITKAARLLGVHPNTLRTWSDQGRLPCLRVTSRGDRRFLVEDLHAFMLGAQGTPELDRPVAEADREAQIDSIAKLGTRLNHLNSVDDIGAAICLELRQLIDYHNVRVYRVYGEDMVPVAWRGEIGEYTGEDVGQLRLRVGEGITGWVAEHGVAEYLPDAAADPLAPEKVSPAVVWLCSDAAAGITGRTFVVAGNTVHLLAWQSVEIARRPNEDDEWSVASIGEKIAASSEDWPAAISFQDLM